MDALGVERLPLVGTASSWHAHYHMLYIRTLQRMYKHCCHSLSMATLTLGIQGMDLSTISTTWSGSMGA
jgi:hypothetical protein